MVSRRKYYDLKTTQAERVIQRFGGHSNLCKCLLAAGFPKTLSTIYRWEYPKDRGGTGGIIPNDSLREVIIAARIEGIFLTKDDLDPRVIVKTTWVEKLVVKE